MAQKRRRSDELLSRAARSISRPRTPPARRLTLSGWLKNLKGKAQVAWCERKIDANTALRPDEAGRLVMALAGWAVAAVAGAAAPSGNMNGEYVVSSGAGKSAPRFNSDYASKGHEYFDV